MVWVFVALVVMSATGILYAALGPLRATPSAPVLKVVAVVQYGVAGILSAARLAGYV